jgi:shikimate dehydrogenase
MNRTRPLIVVTLPARRLAEVGEQAREAARAGADAAELRADRLPRPELAGLGRLFPSPLPMVATYRSRAEGGDGDDDPVARRRVLLGLASHPFRWIDLEIARDGEAVSELPPAESLGRIFSCHVDRGDEAAWIGPLAALETSEGIGKLVVRASLTEALGALRTHAARVGPEVVVHTTGPSGALYRGWSRRFGFPLVYAAPPSGRSDPAVEPSQIPVDRLRPFLDAEAGAPLFALCGRPVAHSLSPRIHSEWMREDGRVGLYILLEVADDREFLDALGPLAEGGFRGVNVTHPFKAVAAEAATEVGAGARTCGVANCLSFHEGEVVAENTDLLAILRRLGELRAAGRWDGRSLVVVGAGGAARATLAAARELGARAAVLARRPEAARRLAEEFGASDPPRGPPGPGALVVHATDVGRVPGVPLDMPIAPLLAPGVHLLDWVYSPGSSVVRDAATAASATYEDGWRLLVYQAAATFEIWWGHPPPPASVARLASEAPCAA